MSSPETPAPTGEKKGIFSKIGNFLAHKPEETGPTLLERANGEQAQVGLETARVIDSSSRAARGAERGVDLAQALPEAPVAPANLAEARANLEAAAAAKEATQATPEQPVAEQRDAA